MALPATRIGPPSCCFSFPTSSATSPWIRVELFHSSGSSSVEETTYFGIELILSANGPSRSGQAAAKDS